MRLAALSDIHGNLPALEAVLADARAQGVDAFLVAGDTVGGPGQQAAHDRLRALGAHMIRGNYEDYCLAFDRGIAPKAWWTSYQWSTLRWSYQHLDRETLDFIAALPDQRVVTLDRTAAVRVVHGSPSHPAEHLFPDNDPVALEALRAAALVPKRGARPLAAVLAGIDEAVLICGHSHVPWQQAGTDWLALNAGSVGAPANGDPRAQYMLLTWRAGRWRAEHRAVAYDMDVATAAWHDSGLLAVGGSLARAWLLGMQRGQPLRGWFVAHLYQLAAKAGWAGGDLVPDEVWAEAVATFDWGSGSAAAPGCAPPPLTPLRSPPAASRRRRRAGRPGARRWPATRRRRARSRMLRPRG